jgi:hypothetical protein
MKSLYMVICIASKVDTIGYRGTTASAINKHEAIGVAMEKIQEKYPNHTLSAFDTIKITEETFTDVGIDPIEYFPRKLKE